MLATNGPPPTRLAGWSAEPKLDGWRAVVTVAAGQVEVRTRTGRPIHVPELAPLAELGLDVILDGELIAAAGRASDFYAVAPALARRRPVPRDISFAAFDVLWLQGTHCTEVPQAGRRRLLEQLEVPRPAIVVPSFDAGDAADLLGACETLGVEGLVLKDGAGRYQPGARSRSWRKVKCTHWRHQHAPKRRPRAAAS